MLPLDPLKTLNHELNSTFLKIMQVDLSFKINSQATFICYILEVTIGFDN